MYVKFIKLIKNGIFDFIWVICFIFIMVKIVLFIVCFEMNKLSYFKRGVNKIKGKWWWYIVYVCVY